MQLYLGRGPKSNMWALIQSELYRGYDADEEHPARDTHREASNIKVIRFMRTPRELEKVRNLLPNQNSFAVATLSQWTPPQVSQFWGLRSSTAGMFIVDGVCSLFLGCRCSSLTSCPAPPPTQFVGFGFLLCCNCFLEFFTFLPLRAIFATFQLVPTLLRSGPNQFTRFTAAAAFLRGRRVQLGRAIVFVFI